MDAQFLRSASGALVIAAVLALLVVLFAVKSIGTKVVIVVVLAAAVFGLAHYRQTLDHCGKVGCSCELFGQQVQGDRCSNV